MVIHRCVAKMIPSGLHIYIVVLHQHGAWRVNMTIQEIGTCGASLANYFEVPV